MQTSNGTDQLRVHDRWLNTGLLALTIAAATGAYFTLIGPVQADIAEVRTQTTELEAIVQRAPTITRANRKLKDALKDVENAIEKLELRIPTAPRESDFLAQICQLASTVGMEVVDYQSGSTQLFETHREMEVTLNTRGEYEPLCRLFEQLDQIPRVYRLTSLEISPEPTGHCLTAVLSFRIYFAAPAEPIPAKGKA